MMQYQSLPIKKRYLLQNANQIKIEQRTRAITVPFFDLQSSEQSSNSSGKWPMLMNDHFIRFWTISLVTLHLMFDHRQNRPSRQTSRQQVSMETAVWSVERGLHQKTPWRYTFVAIWTNSPEDTNVESVVRPSHNDLVRSVTRESIRVRSRTPVTHVPNDSPTSRLSRNTNGSTQERSRTTVNIVTVDSVKVETCIDMWGSFISNIFKDSLFLFIHLLIHPLIRQESLLLQPDICFARFTCFDDKNYRIELLSFNSGRKKRFADPFSSCLLSWLISERQKRDETSSKGANVFHYLSILAILTDLHS